MGDELGLSRLNCVSWLAVYVISWILTAALQTKPIGNIGYFGYILATGVSRYVREALNEGPELMNMFLHVEQIFIVPLPLLVIFDLVKTRPFFYQAWLWCATWGFSIIVLVDM